MQRTRVRFRKKASPGRWSSIYNGTQWPSSFLPEDDFNMVWIEMMEDITGNKPNWNPVSHVRLYSTPGQVAPCILPSEFPFGDPTVVLWTGSWLPPNLSAEGPAIAFTEAFLGDLNENSGFLSDSDASSFARAALDKALDQIPDSVSIANFLIELRDIRNLLPRVRGWRTASDGFLNWSFGWSPIISDIKKFLTLVADVRARLDHLKKVNHRTVTLSHQRRFILVNDESPPPYTGVYTSELEGYGFGLCQSKPNFLQVDARINMKVAYDLDLGGSDAFIQAMCSALGLMNPTKIIWNAIPLSFIVDWFINLNDFLDSATEVQPFKGTMKVLSADTTYKTKMFLGHWNPITNSEMGQFATSLVRGFFRRHGTPNRTIVFDGLTPYQQALAVALIASNGGTCGRRRLR